MLKSRRTAKKRKFQCRKCKGQSVPTNSFNSTQVHIDGDTFKAVPTFWYFGDVIGELDTLLQRGVVLGNY